MRTLTTLVDSGRCRWPGGEARRIRTVTGVLVAARVAAHDSCSARSAPFAVRGSLVRGLGDRRDLVRAVQHIGLRLVQTHERPERCGGGGQPVAGVGGLVVLDYDRDRPVGVAVQAGGAVPD